ncbi:MAG: hypothetical protein CL573_06410 [Alphaproteobacteria bacterium]|nr:hypothetical protein [Alphaproteobacteria bacterium]HCP01880.1 hypothetical protein [Rhodospirillaceae bacterium]
MRPNANNRRARGRGGRKSGNSRNQTFDSNGPGARVRGNPSQIYEKYQQLARDAASSGDRVGAENFLQHAEHYFRLMSAAAAKNEQRNNPDENSRDESVRDESVRDESSRGSGNGHGAFVEDIQTDDEAKPDGDTVDHDGDAKQNGRKRRSRRSNGRGREAVADAAADEKSANDDSAVDGSGDAGDDDNAAG